MARSAAGSQSINRTALGSITMTGTDAYTQVAVPTGLNATSALAWMIKSFEIEPASASLNNISALAGDFSLETQLTKATKAAIVQLSDEDVICKMAVASGLTTSGAWIREFPLDHEIDPGVLVVSDNIYVGVDSTGAGGAFTFHFRVNYEVIQLTEMDYLRLLAAT